MRRGRNVSLFGIWEFSCNYVDKDPQYDDDAGNRNRLKRCHKDFWDLVERWHGRDATRRLVGREYEISCKHGMSAKLLEIHTLLCVCVYIDLSRPVINHWLSLFTFAVESLACLPGWMVGVIANLILIQKSPPFANKAMRVECIFSGRRRRVVQVTYYCNCSGIGIISSCIVSPLSRTNDHSWEVLVTDHQSSKWRWWWCCWVSRRNVQSNAIVAFVSKYVTRSHCSTYDTTK